MTIIAFYGNPEIAVVAADRLVTYPDFTVAENDRTKLLTWHGGLIFGFTGLAFLPRGRRGMPTMEWLAHEISEQHYASGGSLDFGLIAENLSKLRLPKLVGRLAIGAVGFIDGVPTSVLISNMHTHEGAVQNMVAKQFHASMGSYDGEVFNLLGATPSDQGLAILRDRIPQVRSNPRAVAQLLAGVIEHSVGRTVGSDAMCAWLHRDNSTHPTIVSEVVTPGLMKPGSLVDFAMPIDVSNGIITIMPPQKLRLGRKGPQNS